MSHSSVSIVTGLGAGRPRTGAGDLSVRQGSNFSRDKSGGGVNVATHLYTVPRFNKSWSHMFTPPWYRQWLGAYLSPRRGRGVHCYLFVPLLAMWIRCHGSPCGIYGGPNDTAICFSSSMFSRYYHSTSDYSWHPDHWRPPDGVTTSESKILTLL